MNRALLCLLVSTFSGCVSLTREAPETIRYVLDAERASPKVANPIDVALEVRSLHATPPFGNRKLVFRDGDDTVEVDFYREFIVPPATAVTTWR